MKGAILLLSCAALILAQAPAPSPQQSGASSTGGGGGAPTGPCGGDTGGTYPNCTVLSLAHLTTGVNVATASATSGTVTLNSAGAGFTGATAAITKFIVGPITGTTTIALGSIVTGPIEVDVTQDATGGRVLNWPGAFAGVCPASLDASATTVISGIWDGTVLNNPACRVSGVGLATLISVGGTASPAAGSVRFGWDSTALTWLSVDSNGKLHTMPIVASGKMPTFDNSIEYAGTDGTKITGPTISGTIAPLVVNGAFTETQSCTNSSAASKKFTATVTIPANTLTSLADRLLVVMDLTWSQVATPQDIGWDLELDGNNAFTMAAAPNANVFGVVTNLPQEVSFTIWPTAVAAGTNSVLNSVYNQAMQGNGSVTSRTTNGTAAIASVNLGATHTLGFQMECTSATPATPSSTELFSISVYKQ